MSNINMVQIPKFATIQRLLAPTGKLGERVVTDSGERLMPEETAALQSVFSLDYMGRAEFEQGDLAPTVRALREGTYTQRMWLSITVDAPALQSWNMKLVADDWPDHIPCIINVYVVVDIQHLEALKGWIQYEEARRSILQNVTAKENTYFQWSVFLKEYPFPEDVLEKLTVYTKVRGWMMYKPFPAFYTIDKEMYDAFCVYLDGKIAKVA